MRHLYVLILIASSPFCIIAQERSLTAIQRKTIQYAQRMRDERSYDDLNQTQKIDYIQRWLCEDVYEDLASHVESQLTHEIPEVTFEEIQDALKEISQRSDMLCMELRETSDRSWAIDMLNAINLQLLPINNVTDMFKTLQKMRWSWKYKD